MGGGPIGYGAIPSLDLLGAASSVGSALQNQSYAQQQAAMNNQMATAAQANAWQAQMVARDLQERQNPALRQLREMKERQEASVASTAASRVQKADWEMEYDRKDREVDEMIERQRQERERVRIEEVSHVVEAEKHSEAVSGSFGHDGGNED